MAFFGSKKGGKEYLESLKELEGKEYIPVKIKPRDLRLYYLVGSTLKKNGNGRLGHFKFKTIAQVHEYIKRRTILHYRARTRPYNATYVLLEYTDKYQSSIVFTRYIM